MTRITDTMHCLASIAVVLIIGVAGLAVPRGCSRQDLIAEQKRKLDQAIQERDSARARSIRVLDSAVEADAERDQAWMSYVRAFRDSNEQAMQRSSQGAAARARREVVRHGGTLPEAPDTGSGRPPCIVTLTCSEAAAWQASDSLMRAAAESTASWIPVTAAACSTKVSVARVTCESACADRSRNAAAGLRFRDAFIALVGVGILGVVAGWMGAQ